MTATTATAAATTDDAAEQLESLERQLEDVEDAIGEQAITWRAAAADPAAMGRAAQRLTVLERQRDMLRQAKADAEQVISQSDEEGNAERVQIHVQQIRAEVATAVERRLQMGQDLAAAVDRVGELVRGLYDQSREIGHLFAPGQAAAAVSGVDASITHAMQGEDFRYVVDQVLAWRLGKELWPAEKSPASRTLEVAERVRRECLLVLGLFDKGVAARIGDLKVPA